MSISYEKVTFCDGDKKRTVFLRLTGDSSRFLSGFEVDRQGEEIVPVGFERRMRMIAKDVICQRRVYVMDRHYGELMPMRSDK